MRDYTEIARLERDGFEIIVDKTWEDIDPEDHFEPEDAEEICDKINKGIYEWFMLRVRVLLDGHEFGSHYLGGCLYDWNKVTDVMSDGTAEDCIYSAMEEAKQGVQKLKAKLETLAV